MEEIVYEDVGYKGEPGTLTVNDKIFHYQAHSTKTSVKCSWARVEKRQLSPETAKAHMIKLILYFIIFVTLSRRTMKEKSSILSIYCILSHFYFAFIFLSFLIISIIFLSFIKSILFHLQ